MNDRHLIDIDWLKTRYKGDIQGLLKIYRTENDECLDGIAEAMRKGDYDDVRSVAHKMKGSSRIIGAFDIEKLAIEIEETMDADKLKKLVSELEEVYANLKVEISYLLRG